MTDTLVSDIYTLFSDISEFNNFYSDLYPHQFISYRANDGTYQDKHFSTNHKLITADLNSGKLLGAICYLVWEPNWQQTVSIFKSMVGAPHPKLAVMLDVESWGGRIHGNQSAGINGARELLISWLGGNRKRVIGYGNVNDLDTIWPTRGDAQLIVANYSFNPTFPNKLAHQFADNWVTAPFGPSDINSADGYSPTQLAAALGLAAPAPAPKPVPTPTPKPAPVPAPVPSSAKESDMLIVTTSVSDWPTGLWPGIFLLANNSVKHIAHMTDYTAYRTAGIGGAVTLTKDDFLMFENVTKEIPPVTSAAEILHPKTAGYTYEDVLAVDAKFAVPTS